jgi:hypothetical protein
MLGLFLEEAARMLRAFRLPTELLDAMRRIGSELETDVAVVVHLLGRSSSVSGWSFLGVTWP